MEQVKVNAIIPDTDREMIRLMAKEYGATVQRIVAVLVGFGIRNMTDKQVRAQIKREVERSPTRKYQRTKPI